MKVVGTMFFKDSKLLIDKPRRRSTYQMIGGKVEDDESPIEAAIRECHEELGKYADFDEKLFELVMEFDEIATSDGVTPIHFYVFKYNGNLFSIEEIKTHFVNDYYVYEVICREDSYTIIFNGKYWYIDGNNWIDYMGLRKKSL